MLYAGKETPYYDVGEGNRTAYIRLGNERVPAEYYIETFSSLRSESLIRHSRVFCIHWNGLDKAHGLMDAIDDEEYSGSLLNLLQDSVKFVARNTKKAWRKTGHGRIEMPDGSKVQNLDLRKVSSKRRNPIIADIFNWLNYMDRRGSGFKKILDSYEFQEHYTEDMKPEFKSGASDFWLIFKNLNYEAKDIEDALAGESTNKERQRLNQNGQDMDKMIIYFCREPKSMHQGFAP